MTKAEERRAYLAQSAAKPQETTKNTISKADQRRMQLQQAQQPTQQVVAQQPVVQQPVQPKNNGILSSAGLSGLKAMDNRPAETIPVQRQTAQYGKGNINLNNRPVVKNNDGSISTVRSMSFSDGKNEILIPTVVNGKVVSDDEAIEHYYKTGEYLGKFNTIEEANKYAEELHKSQEQKYTTKKQSIAEQSRNYINSLAPIQQASAYATSRPVVANNQKKAELKKQIDELNKNNNRTFSTNDFTLDTNFAEQQRHINELAEEVARKKEIAENSKGLKENERYVREYNEKLAELNKATNDYNNALKYDKEQGNMASDIAKSLDTNTKGGMANIMSGWSRTGSKLSGYDATTIDANALYNYMQPQEESDNPYALLGNALREGASYYGTRIMPGGAALNEALGGGVETPNVAFGRLEDLHKMYPNNLELTNLYNAIASKQYNGTAEDLKKALNDVQLSLDRQFQNQYFQDEYDAVQNQAIRNENKYGGASWIPNAFGTVGNMLPSILMGYATGGIGELAGGGSMALAGSAANKAQQLGSLGNLGMGAANQATNQAIAEGADYNQALMYGALTGLTEAGTEMLGGEAVNAAFGQVGKSALSKLVGKGIDKLAIKSKVGKVIAGLASDVAGEMTEEMISEAVNPLWKAATYDKDALPQNSEELGQYFKDILNAGLEAIPSTLLMAGGGNVVRVGKVNQIENGILKSIQESDLSPIVKTQLENEVRKASTDVKLGLEESDTIENAANTKAASLAQQSAEMAAKIPEGYSLPQSTTDILAYVENSRPGLNIAFDTNVKGNGSFLDNGDGTRTITLNPKSQKAVEFVLTHELGHDLKGTKEYGELQQVLQDYAKGKQGYKESLAALEKTYRESGANFNLQDEATNDMLGSAIGEQEFYNKLAEHPTLFNKFTNKLNELIGSKESKLKTKVENLTKKALQQEYKGKQEGTQQSLSEDKYLNSDYYSTEQIEEIKKQIPKYRGLTQEKLDKAFSEADANYRNMQEEANRLSKEYKEFQNSKEFMEALQNYDFESETWKKAGEYADKIRYYNNAAAKYFAQREAINNINLGKEQDTRTVEQIIKDAEEHFGITNDFNETGYIAPDGNQLNFSGSHEGGTRGTRGLDHRQINEIGTDYDSFISYGNIRILPESGGINLRIEPTKQQYAKLRDYIDFAKQKNGEIYIDIDGENRIGKGYIKETPTERIINDIKNYFETGEYPNSRFLFSKNNASWQGFLDNNLDLAKGTKTNFLPTTEELQQQEQETKAKETEKIARDVETLNMQEEEKEEQPVTLVQSEDDTLFSLTEEQAKEVEDYINELDSDNTIDSKFKNRILDKLEDVKSYSKFQDIMKEVKNYKDNVYMQIDNQDTKQIIKKQTGAENNKQVNKISKNIAAEFNQGNLTSEKLDQYVQDIGKKIKIPTQDSIEYFNQYKGLKDTLRKQKIYIPDNIKNGITDYNDFRKSNMGTLNLTSDSSQMGVDQVWQELRETYPEMLPEEIVNPIDQLEYLSDLAKGIKIKKGSFSDVLDKEYGNGAWDFTSNELRKDFMDLFEEQEKKAQAHIKEAENYDVENEKIAELLKERPTIAKMTLKQKLEQTQRILTNRGYFVDKLARVSGNNQLKYKYDRMLSAANEGNYVVGEKQTDNNGNVIGKSVNDIWKPVEDAGKVQEFSEYLLHKLNVDRMSLEATPEQLVVANNEFANFIKEHPEFASMRQSKIEKLANSEKKGSDLAQEYLALDKAIDILENRTNKPVFSENVTANDSKKAIAEYEKNNPEFKEWAKDINTFNKNQLQNMVDAGLTSVETQELLNSMYDNYIRIQRDISGNAPIVNQRGKLKVNNPIKKATGGNSDILPLKDSMAQQAMEVKKAISRNLFGLELLDTLKNGKVNEEYGEVLEEGKKDKAPSFTVFKDGVPITMEINQDLYDAIKPSERYSFEDSLIMRGLQKGVVMQKTLLTSRNPIFAIVNFLRDLQTAIVNSKDTPKMLLNYAKLAQFKTAEYLNKKGNQVKGRLGIDQKELNSKYDERARLWDLYKANGGESNTYFDFENGTNVEAKNPVKRFINNQVDRVFALNEVIEQLPRVSEFMTTLQNGGTIDEAMYNAADVTVNFKRGGEFTKMLDRNGASFLNASVQGLEKQIRNITDAFSSENKGKAIVNLIIKTALLGIAPQLLNHLILHDDDDYEDLPNYIKDNYWLFKIGDNKFLRIPRGRDIPTFLGTLAQRTSRAIAGEENAFDGVVDTFSNSLAPNNPLESNILAPIVYNLPNNKTWNGSDIVPTRLQELEPHLQYDAKDTEFAKWLAGTDLGKKLGISPKKLDYLIDQYSGGIGDFLIPINTKYAEENNPITSKFVTDSITNNKNVNEFYDTKSSLQVKKNSDTATETERLQSAYYDSIGKSVSELYKAMREIEASNLEDKDKIKQTKEMKQQINELTKTANTKGKEFGEAGAEYYNNVYDELIDSDLFKNRSEYHGKKMQEKLNDLLTKDSKLKAQEKLGTEDFVAVNDYYKNIYDLNETIQRLEEANIPLYDYYAALATISVLSQGQTKDSKQKAIKDYMNLSEEEQYALFDILDILKKEERK